MYNLNVGVTLVRGLVFSMKISDPVVKKSVLSKISDINHNKFKLFWMTLSDIYVYKKINQTTKVHSYEIAKVKIIFLQDGEESKGRKIASGQSILVCQRNWIQVNSRIATLKSNLTMLIKLSMHSQINVIKLSQPIFQISSLFQTYPT